MRNSNPANPSVTSDLQLVTAMACHIQRAGSLSWGRFQRTSTPAQVVKILGDYGFEIQRFLDLMEDFTLQRLANFDRRNEKDEVRRALEDYSINTFVAQSLSKTLLSKNITHDRLRDLDLTKLMDNLSSVRRTLIGNCLRKGDLWYHDGPQLQGYRNEYHPSHHKLDWGSAFNPDSETLFVGSKFERGTGRFIRLVIETSFDEIHEAFEGKLIVTSDGPNGYNPNIDRFMRKTTVSFFPDNSDEATTKLLSVYRKKFEQKEAADAFAKWVTDYVLRCNSYSHRFRTQDWHLFKGSGGGKLRQLILKLQTRISFGLTQSEEVPSLIRELLNGAACFSEVGEEISLPACKIAPEVLIEQAADSSSLDEADVVRYLQQFGIEFSEELRSARSKIIDEVNSQRSFQMVDASKEAWKLTADGRTVPSSRIYFFGGVDGSSKQMVGFRLLREQDLVIEKKGDFFVTSFAPRSLTDVQKKSVTEFCKSNSISFEQFSFTDEGKEKIESSFKKVLDILEDKLSWLDTRTFSEKPEDSLVQMSTEKGLIVSHDQDTYGILGDPLSGRTEIRSSNGLSIKIGEVDANLILLVRAANVGGKICLSLHTRRT